MLALLLVAGVAGPSAAQQEAAQPWFKIDSLNAGLPPVPDDVQRDTPQSAMETFLTAVSQDRYDRAAHILDLGILPANRQPDAGPELARMLQTIIERKVIIDWFSLPDVPDLSLIHI